MSSPSMQQSPKQVVIVDSLPLTELEQTEQKGGERRVLGKHQSVRRLDYALNVKLPHAHDRAYG